MAMIRSRNTVILLLALSVCALPLCRGEEPTAPKWAIRGGKVVTVTKGTLEGAVVRGSGGRIGPFRYDPQAHASPQ